jgi:ATP-binding cassette subfamily B protein
MGATQRTRRGGLSGLRGVLPLLAPYRLRITGATIALTVTAGVTLALGQGLKALVDGGFTADGLDLGLGIFAALIVLLAAGTFCRFYLVSWLGERVAADLRRAVYANLLRQDAAFFERNGSAEIASRLTADITLLQTLIGSSASVALRNALMGTGGLALMFVTDVRLSLLALVSVPVVVLPIAVFGRRVRQLSRSSQDRIADVGSHASETLAQIKVVKAFNRERDDAARFARHVESAFAVARARIASRAWLTAFVMLLVFAAVAVLFRIGAADVLSGRISAGELAAFVFYAVMVAGATGAIGEVFGDLQRAAGALERLQELQSARPDIVAPPVPAVIVAPRGDVSFEHVGFRYPTREQAVLTDVSFHVQPGQRVALVGASGAGKSTVLELLLRLYDPQAGVIRFDGVDLRDLDPEAYRRLVAIVPQQPLLFAGSIADAVRMGRPDASDHEVAAALEQAQLGDWLADQPEGMLTQVGERGQALSGGQRQRVAIARALLKAPRLLLLDEATSALDAASESAVRTALAAAMDGRTTIVVAHRLATVRDADRILVMDAGRIVDSGSHEALMRTPHYARLAAAALG